MSINKTLIVFARPLELGNVKKRLARTIGKEKALAIYSRLMDLTIAAGKNADVDTIVYFSDPPKYTHNYINNIQRDGNLGKRMLFAIANEINNSGGFVCLIGSDCPDISSIIINDAMQALETNDVVLGPASDGGYYLIGLKNQYPALFENINWGSNSVLAETKTVIKRLGLSVHLLPELSDIDQVEDLPPGW